MQHPQVKAFIVDILACCCFLLAWWQVRKLSSPPRNYVRLFGPSLPPSGRPTQSMHSSMWTMTAMMLLLCTCWKKQVCPWSNSLTQPCWKTLHLPHVDDVFLPPSYVVGVQHQVTVTPKELSIRGWVHRYFVTFFHTPNLQTPTIVTPVG